MDVSFDPVLRLDVDPPRVAGTAPQRRRPAWIPVVGRGDVLRGDGPRDSQRWDVRAPGRGREPGLGHGHLRRRRADGDVDAVDRARVRTAYTATSKVDPEEWRTPPATPSPPITRGASRRHRREPARARSGATPRGRPSPRAPTRRPSSSASSSGRTLRASSPRSASTRVLLERRHPRRQPLDRAGTLLGRVTFMGETASGWQSASSTRRCRSMRTRRTSPPTTRRTARYSVDTRLLRGSPRQHPPLRALRDGVAGGNGVFVLRKRQRASRPRPTRRATTGSTSSSTRSSGRT